MTDQSPAQRFAAALQSFESRGDVEELTALFADQPELLRPEVSGSASASSDPAGFWDEYRRQFESISTEFSHVTECDEHGVLEWGSQGRLSTGRDITYRGVSLLFFDGDGRISRFATYYDTAAFIAPTNEGTDS